MASGFAQGIALSQRARESRRRDQQQQFQQRQSQQRLQMQQRQNVIAAEERFLAFGMDPNNARASLPVVADMMLGPNSPNKAKLIEVIKIGRTTRDAQQQLVATRSARGQALTNALDPTATPEERGAALGRVDFLQGQAASLSTPQQAATNLDIQASGVQSGLLSRDLEARRGVQAAQATRQADSATRRREALDFGTGALKEIKGSGLAPDVQAQLLKMRGILAGIGPDAAAAGITVGAGQRRGLERAANLETATETLSDLLDIAKAQPDLFGAGGALRRRGSTLLLGLLDVAESVPGVGNTAEKMRLFLHSSQLDMAARTDIFESEQDRAEILRRSRGFLVDGRTIGTMEALSFHMNFAMARLFADTGRVSVAVLERLEEFNSLNRNAPRSQNIQRLTESLQILSGQRDVENQILDKQGLGDLTKIIREGIEGITVTPQGGPAQGEQQVQDFLRDAGIGGATP